MKNQIALLVFAVALVLAGCGPSADQSAKAREAKGSKVTTRWKWNAESVVAVSKGLIIEQTGDVVEATFVHLKEVDGFVVDSKISQGKYFADKRKLVLPPAQMTSEEIDLAIKMDVARVEVQFTPDAQVLKARWVGQTGSPHFDMNFVRVQD